jgi:hypothetical protein
MLYMLLRLLSRLNSRHQGAVSVNNARLSSSKSIRSVCALILTLFLVSCVPNVGTPKAYIESMPRPCFVGDSGTLYRQKHNPFVYYDSIRENPTRCQRAVPLDQFTADLAAHAVPNYVWVSPNMCSDGHDCASSKVDGWLSRWVPKILASPEWRDDGVLFITFDEGDKTQLFPGRCCVEGIGGHVATLVVSLLGKPHYSSPIAYDHYSLLRTIEDSWGLPELGGASCTCAPPMSDFFLAGPVAARR